MKLLNTNYGRGLVLFIFLSHMVYSQGNDTFLNEIKGRVTHFNAALSDVHIINKNQNTGTKTNSNGNYEIHAVSGDVLQFSYVGFKTVSIVIEDITSVLNVKMISEINELEEAVVIADRKLGKELERALKAEKKFTSGRGVIDPRALGSSIYYFDGNNISPQYLSITEALQGKFPGKIPLVWDVDGGIYDEEPPISLANIKDIHIITSVAGSIKWGGRGVIIIRTISGSPNGTIPQKKGIALQHTNKNYYNNDAKTNYSNYSQENKILKEIRGKVTYQNSALPDVNIINKSGKTGTKSNAQGNYTIQAKTGDILQFSYVGMKTVNIAIEDITNVLNIDMVIEITELEETVVKTNTSGKEYRRAKRAEKKFTSSMGTFDPKTAGYAVATIDGVEINIGNGTLTQALVGKLAGYYIDEGKPFLRAGNMSITQSYPAIWDIDGAVYTEEPQIDISLIKDIHVLKSLAAVNRYGNIANGGVIIVRTQQGSFDGNEKNKNNLADRYTNQEYYNDDAIEINKESFITNPFTKTLTDLKIKQKAFAYYNDSLKSTIKDYNTHIGLAQDFNNYYKDKNLSLQILNDLAIKHNKNPEILKVIAFQMQEYGFTKYAIEVYKNIFKLRPKYAQSYRDLANAYLEDNQYKKAWKMYMSYLLKGNDVSGEGIGELLYNEMEWLYFNRKNESAIKVNFQPKSENILDFRNDIRLVFEWNTSEAEFDLEFVNPQKQVYNFEHSLYKNQTLINDEKHKGYSSKEFIIDDVKQGQWLVNLTYQGNKKPEPTYLKVTTYYYWGKPNQHQKTAVYKLDKEHEKIQLYRLNKESLLVKK